MDPRVRQHIAKHEQECLLRQRSAAVSFDYFRDGELVRRETYLINERGNAVLARAASRLGQPRYRIDEACR
jgi:hypothetical protein